MNDEQLLRYARHILLDELGIEGQERLLAARVLIVGAGGLGSPAALYLATAGVGDITLADDDVVELSNLQRQILHTTASVGRPKAESGRDMLAAFNPQARVHARVERLQGQALSDAVAAADLVLDCTDNFTTRHAINRACVEHRKPLVSGAAIRFDGQVSVYDLRDDKAPCYHCLFPRPMTSSRPIAPPWACSRPWSASWQHAGRRGPEAAVRRRRKPVGPAAMAGRAHHAVAQRQCAARPGMSGLRTPARLKIHAVPYRLQPVSPACYWPCGQCMD